VLLGMVDEAFAGLDLHRSRFNCKDIVERSGWLLLSNDLPKISPVAEISNLQINASDSTNGINRYQDLLQFLQENGNKKIKYQNNHLSFDIAHV